MSLLPRLVFIAIWILKVQARNETLVHGWVPEPNGRVTWSILWSCLATIFICTWSALHLDVPKRHGFWYLLFRKLGWMLVAMTAPEFILYDAAGDFFRARKLSKHLVGRGYREWTLTQTQFACAGGFWTRTQQGEASKCSPKQLGTFIKREEVDGPSISVEELRSRGKSDWVVKVIAVLQIIWFVVQTLCRAIQHYQITALEIMTVAFVFCSIFTYGFSMCLPQNVEYPVVLEVRSTAQASDERTPKETSESSGHAGERPEPLSPTRRQEKVESGLPSKFVWGRASGNVPDILLVLFACGFGAIHCLAWNSSFPTPKERLAWRICSVTTTASPALVALIISLELSIKTHGKRYLGESVIGWTLVLLIVSYVLGRATIIVLAFMTLRALPTDAFQTVNWSDYLPHFAA